MVKENDQHAFSEQGFWAKLKTHGKKIGRALLEQALKLYYAGRDPETPIWAKSTIFGALGYFISPLDLVPDLTPVMGYSDDATVLAAAISMVAAHIKSEHTERAKQTVTNWFE